MCRGLPGGTSLDPDDDGDGWGGSEAAMEQASPQHSYGLPPQLEVDGYFH